MIKELAPCFGHSPDSIQTTFIGSKPGEKLYEELMTGEETRRTMELPRYFAVIPAFSSMYKAIAYTYPEIVNDSVTNPYNSATESALTQEELRNFLYENELLEGDATETFRPDHRYWGDEKKDTLKSGGDGQ